MKINFSTHTEAIYIQHSYIFIIIIFWCDRQKHSLASRYLFKGIRKSGIHIWGQRTSSTPASCLQPVNVGLWLVNCIISRALIGWYLSRGVTCVTGTAPGSGGTQWAWRTHSPRWMLASGSLVNHHYLNNLSRCRCGLATKLSSTGWRRTGNAGLILAEVCISPLCSLVTRQPLPVNSLDVVGGSLVLGGDTEAFYVLHNVIA